MINYKNGIIDPIKVREIFFLQNSLTSGIYFVSFDIFLSNNTSTVFNLAVIPPRIVNGMINKSQTRNMKIKVDIGTARVDYLNDAT